MRLLLDEMYPPVIAEQLRRRGHNANAVTTRPELRTLPDPDLFLIAQEERRALVTENIVDFTTIADSYDERARAHYGLVLVDASKYPRGNARTIGRMVTGLDRLLHEYPGDGASSSRHWL